MDVVNLVEQAANCLENIENIVGGYKGPLKVQTLTQYIMNFLKHWPLAVVHLL